MSNLQPVSINGVEFDALIDSEEAYEATVPTYPVDSGYSVSDNVAMEAMELSMTLYLTATPITWRSSHGMGENRLRSVCDELLRTYVEREPITVTTAEKTYSNMVIKSIAIKKDDSTGLAREIPITLTQVTVTTSGTVEVPSKIGKSGTTGKSTGKASTSSDSSGTDSGSSSSDSGGSGGSGGSTSDSSSGTNSGKGQTVLDKALHSVKPYIEKLFD